MLIVICSLSTPTAIMLLFQRCLDLAFSEVKGIQPIPPAACLKFPVHDSMQHVFQQKHDLYSFANAHIVMVHHFFASSSGDNTVHASLLFQKPLVWGKETQLPRVRLCAKVK